MTNRIRAIVAVALVGVGLAAAGMAGPPGREASTSGLVVNDVHLHITNFVQKGPGLAHFLPLMGREVGRAAVFGLPLQQEWSFRSSGNFAPTYYLDTDAPLYYYSFTDAYVAMAYRSLPREQQARLDPMIIGFNPADMYAADHIRRVLETFPGVFTGIGEFSIHKEFVSSKVAGTVASLTDPALDRLLDFAAEVGLVVLLHNDVDMPFAKDGTEPIYLGQLKALFRRHPRNTFIWAHTGLGRIVHPVENHAQMVRAIVEDPGLRHVNFDISWTEVAKYLVSTQRSVGLAADLLNRHPDRFLFGTDEVNPPDQRTYLRIRQQYAPLWQRLDPAASEKIRRGNYERLFDEARRRVRAWERNHGLGPALSRPAPG
jgi:predicted TIM-barrel fold metal-dependent hydrolase